MTTHINNELFRVHNVLGLIISNLNELSKKTADDQNQIKGLKALTAGLQDTIVEMIEGDKDDPAPTPVDAYEILARTRAAYTANRRAQDALNGRFVDLSKPKGGDQ